MGGDFTVTFHSVIDVIGDKFFKTTNWISLQIHVISLRLRRERESVSQTICFRYLPGEPVVSILYPNFFNSYVLFRTLLYVLYLKTSKQMKYN